MCTGPGADGRPPMCQDGWQIVPLDGCAAAEICCVFAAPQCVPEGGARGAADGVPPCCDGLVESPCLMPRGEGACTEIDFCAAMCTRCGNHECGNGENPCNCPEDCQPAGGNECAEMGGGCVAAPGDVMPHCPPGTADVPAGGCQAGEVCCMPMGGPM